MAMDSQHVVLVVVLDLPTTFDTANHEVLVVWLS